MPNGPSSEIKPVQDTEFISKLDSARVKLLKKQIFIAQIGGLFLVVGPSLFILGGDFRLHALLGLFILLFTGIFFLAVNADRLIPQSFYCQPPLFINVIAVILSGS